MKETKHLLAIILVVQLVCSCKKDNQGNLQHDPPTGEKKWVVTTFAGDGRALFADGPAPAASFRAPLDVAVAADGTVYVADALNHRIRKISDGQVTTFAGGTTGDTTSGNGSVARFIFPSQLAVNSTGTIYTLDIDDPRVRAISPSSFVSVVAGTGAEGFKDGGPETAEFGEEASGITLDTQGNLVICDFDNRRVRKISTAGQVTTIAGNGSQGIVNGNADTAQFLSLGGVVVDRFGNLFVADQGAVREITPAGVVSTFAGSSTMGYRDGPAADARFTLIGDMVIDNQGNIYLSDENRIRKVSPQGEVSTIAGSVAGFEDGDGASAKFSGPAGLGIDSKGNIYVADASNNRIRKISFE